MIKAWNLQEDVPDLTDFAASLGVTTWTAGILYHRGIRTKEDAAAFFHPEDVPYSDPFLMKDMDKAVARIQQAIKEKEHITIYGDYDVDGMTATSLLLRNLPALGADVSYYIPDRNREGYGFNCTALEHLAETTDLLISVDCGIASVEDVAAVAEKLDIVITDHHLPGKLLPPALAVLDPHRADCAFPEKDICGVGVAFKLLQALFLAIKGERFDRDIELVAIGTVADIVPLVGENRKFVKEGLARIKNSEIPGVAALVEIANLQDKEIGTGHVGFMLAPRINAAGRIGTTKKGVALLTALNSAEAASLARELDALNSERQGIEQEILAKAEEELAEKGMESLSAIIIAGKGWNPGVIGIVASRLVEHYYKPTIVFSIGEDGTMKGSCRSIKGLHMHEALSALSDHILQFGGHEMAAGLSLAKGAYAAFKTAFLDYCRAHLTDEDYIPKISVELEMAPAELSFSLIEELSCLEPYGIGNPKPLFGCRAIRAAEARAMGREKDHLCFEVGTKARPVCAIMWHQGKLADIVNAEPIDIVYTPSINEWNGKKSIQCMVEDLAPADAMRVFPTRSILMELYRFLMGQNEARGSIPFHAEALTGAYNMTASRYKKDRMSYYTMCMGLRIFQELGILRADVEEKVFHMPKLAGKTELLASPTYRRGMRAYERKMGKA